MNRLPFYTVVMLATGILAWNFSFYRGYYQAQAGGPVRVHDLPVQPGELSARGGPGPGSAMHGSAELADGLLGLGASNASGRRSDVGAEGSRRSSTHDLDPDGDPGRDPGGDPGGDKSRGPTRSGVSDLGALGSEHYPGGNRRSEGYRFDGRREGAWTEWYESGEPLSRGRYEEDLRDGRWLYWYTSGQPQHEGDYDAGRREGLWRSWHENGGRLHEGRYDDGDREGMWRQWYSNGQVMEAGRYVKGLREGWWEFYDFKGRSDKRAGWYESGRRIR